MPQGRLHFTAFYFVFFFFFVHSLIFFFGTEFQAIFFVAIFGRMVEKEIKKAFIESLTFQRQLPNANEFQNSS